MRESELGRIVRAAALGVMVAIAGVALPGAATAQQPDEIAQDMRDQYDEDGDNNWGWLGLLGLAGLLGLRRRDRVNHVDTTRRPPVT